VTTTTETKTCKRCGQAKPATKEHFSADNRGNFISKCRPCVNYEAKLRRQRKKQFDIVLQVDVKSGEVLADRRREVCGWLR